MSVDKKKYKLPTVVFGMAMRLNGNLLVLCEHVPQLLFGKFLCHSHIVGTHGYFMPRVLRVTKSTFVSGIA